MKYEDMLKKAKSEMPQNAIDTSRFELEKVKGHIEGNKTVIINFFKIAKDLNRDPDQILKYVLKELATPGKKDGQRIIFGTKVPASNINKKIKKYAVEYVYCPDCGKPDTQLIEENGLKYIKCMACGNKNIIK